VNRIRAENILSGQTNLARKVFAAVPMQEHWNIDEISREMARVEPHNHTKSAIAGCLRTLKECGLISEAGVQNFRSNVKPEPIKKEKVTVSKEEPSKQLLSDRLAQKATALRTQATFLTVLADDLEMLALEMDEALVQAGQKSEKLVKLQSTLKELMEA
jgi:hypothetical protein